MTIFHALLLGVIQGLTEILPISSSAHLVIIPWLCKWPYQGLSFDISLHLGTALAFIAYFLKDWVNLIKAVVTKDATRKNNLLWYIIIATIPAGIAGLFFEKYAETIFRSPAVIAAALFLFAIILWCADRYGKKNISMEKVHFSTALAIGIAQALALIPGVSRSGVTITAGLFKGLTREAAARFSFLIATPIVVAAAGLNFFKLKPEDLSIVFFTGVVSSAISGFIAIRFLLSYIKKSSLNFFVIYRIILAVCILILSLAKKGI